MIEQEFIPYQEALALKELGFDEPCFGYSDNKGKLHYNTNGRPVVKDWIWVDNQILPTDMVLAPTFSQAFRWFREKYNKLSVIDHATGGWYFVIREIGGSTDPMLKAVCGSGLKSYEEAELACLKKLIEIANEKLTDSTRIPT